MKRRILVTFLLLMVGSMLISASNFGLGIEFPGTHEFSYETASTSYDTNMGFGVFSEFYTEMSKSPSVNFEGGFGVAYLFPRGIDDEGFDGDPTVSYLPFYLMGQLVSSGQNSPSLFGKVKFGYDLMFGNDEYSGDMDLNGGLFMGFGGGMILQNNMFIELSYQILNGSIDLNSFRDSDTMDIKQSNLSILLGMRMK